MRIYLIVSLYVCVVLSVCVYLFYISKDLEHSVRFYLVIMHKIYFYGLLRDACVSMCDPCDYLCVPLLCFHVCICVSATSQCALASVCTRRCLKLLKSKKASCLVYCVSVLKFAFDLITVFLCRIKYVLSTSISLFTNSQNGVVFFPLIKF